MQGFNSTYHNSPSGNFSRPNLRPRETREYRDADYSRNNSHQQSVTTQPDSRTPMGKPKCYICGQTTHFARNCPRNPERRPGNRETAGQQTSGRNY
jgi:hypothetical protein